MASGARSLKRLGGGRWGSPDGRFTIESESGRWVVVDAEQTDEFGLPRVHGPYGSLGNARDELERLAGEAPAASPLADRLEAARARPPRPDVAHPSGTRRAATSAKRSPEPDGEPDADDWLRGVPRPDRERARRLRDAVRDAGVEEPEKLVLLNLAQGRPLVAEALLRHRIARAIEEERERGGGRLTARATARLRNSILALLDTRGGDVEPAWGMFELDSTGAPRRRMDPESGSSD